jgi:hypothetical protein
LSWLFLTFLSFLAFSGIVAALSTFFLSDDLRLILATPVASRRLVLRALRAHRRAGGLDGGRIPAAGARRHRVREVRVVVVCHDGGDDRRCRSW